jgi:hypothetical protein
MGNDGPINEPSGATSPDGMAETTFSGSSVPGSLPPGAVSMVFFPFSNPDFSPEAKPAVYVEQTASSIAATSH